MSEKQAFEDPQGSVEVTLLCTECAGAGTLEWAEISPEFSMDRLCPKCGGEGTVLLPVSNRCAALIESHRKAARRALALTEKMQQEGGSPDPSTDELLRLTIFALSLTAEAIEEESNGKITEAHLE